ncbi:MAG TPA: hypothetical protein PKL39_08100 [Bacillota bacterium]|nr:hypothetical protein [Bacillota bacterium]
MEEKAFLKAVLREKLADKEKIRRQALAGGSKGGVSMQRKLALAAMSICIMALMTYGAYAAADSIQYKKAEAFLGSIGISAQDVGRAQAKEIYKDMVTESFQLSATRAVLEKRANELGIEYIPADTEHVFQGVKNYSILNSTSKVTREQVLALESGLTYAEIIETLGPTRDVGRGTHIVQYLVDGKLLLTLEFSQETEVCPLSGEELLGTLRKIAAENNSALTFDAVVLQKDQNSLHVDCPAYDRFDSAWVGVIKRTEILFADGKKATLADIEPGTAVTVTYTGEIRESYPPQVTAVKIVIRTE